MKKAETSGASVPRKPLSQRVTMVFSKFKDKPGGGIEIVGDMAKLFGSPDADYAAFLANQLLCAIPEGCDHTAGALNFATTALESIAPRDGLERLLAVQMIGAHALAMSFLAYAASKNPSEVLDKNVSRAVKLMHIFTTQIEALKLYRSTGQQRVVVEHVHVNAGGQAVVGLVKTESKK